MPNWTWEDVALRNQRIFGTSRPSGAPIEPEEPDAEVPEAMIEAECCRLLAEDGWRILKTDPVSDRRRGKGFGELGMADTLCLRYGRKGSVCEAIWIEWKAPSGRVKKHQAEWHTKERARGAMTVIGGVDFRASVKGFMSWYRASGLARTVISHGEAPVTSCIVTTGRVADEPLRKRLVSTDRTRTGLGHIWG
jgi:hypothetical protein